MPNWTNNTLTLTHKDKTMIERAAKAWSGGTLLNEFVPIPTELTHAEASFSDENTEKNKANIEKYGYASWYDFAVNEWGTKWDISPYGSEVSDDGLSISGSFDTAWAPPTEAYRKLEELGFEVDAMYYEPGCAFCGAYSEGYDESYEIPETSDEVDEEIPSRINEEFAIAESMRDYESENEFDDEEKEA
jgi:hypothetical protein